MAWTTNPFSPFSLSLSFILSFFLLCHSFSSSSLLALLPFILIVMMDLEQTNLREYDNQLYQDHDHTPIVHDRFIINLTYLNTSFAGRKNSFFFPLFFTSSPLSFFNPINFFFIPLSSFSFRSANLLWRYASKRGPWCSLGSIVGSERISVEIEWIGKLHEVGCSGWIEPLQIDHWDSFQDFGKWSFLFILFFVLLSVVLIFLFPFLSSLPLSLKCSLTQKCQMM